jgi:spore maturation protein B
MQFLLYLSDFMIPMVIFIIVGYGLLMKVDIFDAFIRGAAEGIKMVVELMPTLIGLMMAIGILRASGALELFSELLSPVTSFLHFPSELMPLAVIKMFSSSASTGLLLDIFKTYGPDSYLGMLASLLLSSSETIFYTLSVYFGPIGIKNMSYTLAGCLFATLAGMAASTVIAGVIAG